MIIMMKNVNIPWSFLRLEVLSRKRITSREFLHTVLVWRFFSTYSERTEFSELRNHFSPLKHVINSVWNALKITDEYISKFDGYYKKEDFYHCFQKLLQINTNLKIALEKLDFFHRKASYILESFPRYYPAPNVFRARQELKAYEALEAISEGYLKLFGESLFKLSAKYKAHVYWETDPENRFLPIDKYEDSKCIHFFFKGSYYIVNCPSLWILLAHEALHFLWIWCENYYENGDKESFLSLIQELQTDFFINMVALTERLGIHIGQEHLRPIYRDTMCDALLTYLLGTSYFIALWRIIFGFDETVVSCSPKEGGQNSKCFFSHQYITNWWIRLRTCVEVIKEYKLMEKEYYEYFKNVLEGIHTNISKNVREAIDRCTAEKNISRLLMDYTRYLIAQAKQKKWDEEIKQRCSKEAPWLDFDKILTNDILNRLKKQDDLDPHGLKEGRIYVLAFKDNFSQDLCLPGKIKDTEKQLVEKYQNETDPIKKIETKIKKLYSNTQVVLVRFLKIRFDGYDNKANPVQSFFNKMVEDKEYKEYKKYVFLNLGGFQLVHINPDFHDKPKKLDEEEKNILDSLVSGHRQGLKNEAEEKELDFLWRTIREGILLYKEDIAASMLYYKGAETEWQSLQLKPNLIATFFSSLKVILAIVKVKEKDNRDPNGILNFANNLKGIFEEVMIGYSFAWSDWVLFLKLKKSKNYKDSLRRLKTELVYAGFQRTHTSVLVPCSLLGSEDMIATPDVLIRLSGERTDISNLLSKFEINGWEPYLYPGIYDLVLKYNYEEIALNNLHDLMNELISGKLISDLQFQFSLKPYKRDS